jgi:hypothetical protein
VADDLRALAAAATPGPWEVEHHLDMLDPPGSWYIADLERWRGYTNNVGFGEDEATARYVAAVSPDVVVGLLDVVAAVAELVAGIPERIALNERSISTSEEIWSCLGENEILSEVLNDIGPLLAALQREEA